MRIYRHYTRKESPGHRIKARRRHEQGSAALVVIAILAIVLIYVASNLKTLEHLNREIKLVERRQIHRLQSISISTNSVTPTVAPVTNKPASAP